MAAVLEAKSESASSRTSTIQTLQQHKLNCKLSKVRWSLKSTLKSSCSTCKQPVGIFWTNQSKPNLFTDWSETLELLSLKYKAAEANVVKMAKSLCNSEFNESEHGTNEVKWNMLQYTTWHKERVKKLYKKTKQDHAWFWSNWHTPFDEHEWPSWSSDGILNWKKLSAKQKEDVDAYVNVVMEVIDQCCAPNPIHCLGADLVLTIGNSAKRRETVRHYDPIHQGIPVPILLDGEPYQASPDIVTNKLNIKRGQAYTFLSYKFFENKHGYNKSGTKPRIQVILKLLNEKILKDIYENYGDEDEHEYIKIDKDAQKLTYNEDYSKYVETADYNSEESLDDELQKRKQARAKQMAINRSKKKHKSKFGGKERKRRRKQKLKTQQKFENDAKEDENDEDDEAYTHPSPKKKLRTRE